MITSNKGGLIMVLEFATKRDRNGNRYYLGIDTDKKVYSLERGHWYTRDDITEISKKDRHKLIEQIENDYKRLDYFN